MTRKYLIPGLDGFLFTRTELDLLAAARYTERHARKETEKVPTLHLLDCVSMSLGLPCAGVTSARVRYQSAANRLFAAIGNDLADFTKDRAIDALVAAAFWEVPQRMVRYQINALARADLVGAASQLQTIKQLLRMVLRDGLEPHREFVEAAIR